ncbi:MAG TPA: SCO family protein [Solirubrobacteraceae bacterium]|nr:SCO family protein [Solirubrobacteraceae bacterium]
MRRLRFAGAALALAVAALAAAAGLLASAASHSTPRAATARPVAGPVGPPPGPAPDFTLTDQFGQRVSLSSFRGRAVVLAFVDSRCTTICPLTTAAMIDAKQLLGAAGSRVQLIGVDANPAATTIGDVRAYSIAHGMLHQWRFLTGPLPELERVWRAYRIEAQIVAGQVDHTPALYVIDPRGMLRIGYMTAMAFAAIDEQAHVLAQELSRLLPGHPRVGTSPAASLLTPSDPVTLPRAGGGTVHLGLGRSPRLLLFFATWTAGTSRLAYGLRLLDRYQSLAIARHLPTVTAVDEGTVEPSPEALGHFLHRLRYRLSYPVAIDQSGRVADGYQVQDEPWLVLVSGSGRFLYYLDPNAAGWPAPGRLAGIVRRAIALGGRR